MQDDDDEERKKGRKKQRKQNQCMSQTFVNFTGRKKKKSAINYTNEAITCCSKERSLVDCR